MMFDPLAQVSFINGSASHKTLEVEPLPTREPTFEENAAELKAFCDREGYVAFLLSPVSGFSLTYRTPEEMDAQAVHFRHLDPPPALFVRLGGVWRREDGL
jgi:hypothetical protein